ncbi:MAG: RNA polymerase factor sigma-54 [Candidatus Sumerlaeia bacterium]
MPLAMQQVQKLQQRLVMTPQMQQSVKLLQMNTMELEEVTQQEVLENPFLELEEENAEYNSSEEDIANDGKQETEMVREKETDPESDNFQQSDDYETAARKGESSEESGDDSGENESRSENNGDDVSENLEAASVDEQPEQFDEVDTDWQEIFEASETRNYAPPKEDIEERSYEETVAGRSSLYEELEWQLRVSALEGQDLEIGYYLIGCINERGYLQTTVEEVAEHFGVSAEEVEDVLKVVQEFDPTGVGARDLPECLCIQLENLGDLTPMREKALKEHWDELSKNKFRDVAKALEVDEDEIVHLYHRVQKLEPMPGHQYSKDQAIYISPDVYVKFMDGKYVIYLNEGQVAHLRLSQQYKDILLNKDDKGQDPKAKEYALDKYRAAVMFIKNVEKRRNTVLRVTEAIMDYQHEFLEKGVEALRPLALSEIAERVGMHESTISRVTSNKYVDTPQGLFELKFFFSSAIESDRGEAASSRSIKQKIRELIDNENPKKPLSDEKISKQLQEEGFSIARRTVAKYREQMKILPTNLRRRMQ